MKHHRKRKEREQKKVFFHHKKNQNFHLAELKILRPEFELELTGIELAEIQFSEFELEGYLSGSEYEVEVLCVFGSTG